MLPESHLTTIPKPVSQPRREAIPALTGLRFVAALAVVLYHLQVLNLAEFPTILRPVIALGRDGVDLFFVLSGFVIAYNYLDWFGTNLTQRARFLWLRVARVVPLHLACLVLITPVSLFLTNSTGTYSFLELTQSWLANALLLQAWFPLGPNEFWNVPAWSISVEIFCYWLFPGFALAVVPRCRSRRRLIGLAALCWLAGAGIVGALARGSPILGVLAFFLPVTRVWEFLVGAILGSWYLKHGPTVRSAGDRWLLLIFGGVALVAYRPAGLLAGLEWYFFVFPLSVALVIVLSTRTSTLARWLAHPALVRLGDASYAMYLLHWLPVTVLATVAAGRLPVPFWWCLILLASLILASLACYRWFEVPTRRWLRSHQPRPGSPSRKSDQGMDSTPLGVGTLPWR